MPNGGPDNCGTCGFNRANHGRWGHPEGERQEPSFCTIRQVPILTDLWTYCHNWHTKNPVPEGPIFASGLYDQGYVRIPWHGNLEPRVNAAGTCAVCSRTFQGGIEVDSVEGKPAGFCSNAHYGQWWKQQHAGEFRS